MNADDELNKMFRDGLSEPGKQAGYSEADWDALEQMLDERKKRRGIIFWLPLASGIAALLLVFFGWMFLRSGGDKTKPVIAVTKSQPVNQVKGGDSIKQQPTAIKPRDNVAVNTISAATITHTNAAVADGGGQPASDHQNNLVPANHQNIIASNHRPRKGKTGERVEQISQNGGLALVADEYSSLGANQGSLYAVNGFDLDRNTLSRPVNLPLETEEKPVMHDRILDHAKGIKMTRTHMAVTVLAASTANGVGTFSDTKSGADFGALFSFGIKKLTLSTGAIYAKTPYGTDFGNYHTKYQFTTAPLSVNADCRILDIPVNLDYQFYSKRQNKFSVGAGLSSYIMLHEDYDYNYASPATAGPYGYSITNRNQYYFGVLNLDATYQRAINAKLGLSLQPYIKLPLTNIGYGQVKLQTAGVAVGLSYQIK